MNHILYYKKIMVYCLGLFIMALGVSISRVSCLGVSPVNSIPAVLSNIMRIDMGICTTAVFIGFILIQIGIMRRKFKPLNLLQIIPSFLFGSFVSCTNHMCEILLSETQNYIIALLYLIISIVLVAMGILLYLNGEVLSLPGEGVMQAMSYKLHIKVSTAKIMFDWTMIIIATILSLICLGGFEGIREGTILAAFGVGMCLKFLEVQLEKPLRAWIYGDRA